MENGFTVSYSYRVHFTRSVFAVGNPLLAEESARLASPAGAGPPLSCLVVVDAGVAAAHPDLAARIGTYVRDRCAGLRLAGPPLILPGGEKAKDGPATTGRVLEAGLAAGLCRQSFIWAVGGGALLDAVGLAAALLHRGVRLIRFPTTVLSQNDSGVGVKNGINVAGVKNLVGAFAPPAAVICDLDFLRTLEDRDWIAGSAEAFKVALIKDAAFLRRLEEIADRIPARDEAVMEELVRRCAALHLEHIAASGDPFEFGSARPLDFGHWAAHKLEALTGFTLRHGEAVAVGIALDLVYASLLGLVPGAEVATVLAAMRRAGLPIRHDALLLPAAAGAGSGTYRVLEGIDEFREHLGGELHITFPAPLGRRIEVNRIDRRLMSAAIERLERHARTGRPL